MRGDIVVYGAEDRQGRALLAVSALHHCGRWLAGRDIGVRFVATAEGAAVRVAVEVLSAHTGLRVSTHAETPREDPDAVFSDAGLFVGVVFSRPEVLALDEASRRGIPSIGAIQFPDARHLSPAVLADMRCAFDPVELSRRVRGAVLKRAQPGAASP